MPWNSYVLTILCHTSFLWNPYFLSVHFSFEVTTDDAILGYTCKLKHYDIISLYQNYYRVHSNLKTGKPKTSDFTTACHYANISTEGQDNVLNIRQTKFMLCANRKSFFFLLCDLTQINAVLLLLICLWYIDSGPHVINVGPFLCSFFLLSCAACPVWTMHDPDAAVTQRAHGNQAWGDQRKKTGDVWPRPLSSVWSIFSSIHRVFVMFIIALPWAAIS